jgi:hypothetical protein
MLDAFGIEIPLNEIYDGLSWEPVEPSQSGAAALQDEV